MTTEERLIQQGEERGIQKGIQQGERSLLLRLLRRRFGSQVDSDTEQRLATATAEQIGTWADRVLSAASLAELLADSVDFGDVAKQRKRARLLDFERATATYYAALVDGREMDDVERRAALREMLTPHGDDEDLRSRLHAIARGE